MKSIFATVSVLALLTTVSACKNEQEKAQPGQSEATAQATATSKPATVMLTGDTWFDLGQATLQSNLAKKPITHRAKNVILFIGDGMDPTTVTASRIYEGQNKGMSGEENVLAMETLPHLALSKTYSANAQIADSAATASAMNTGVKTKSGAISVTDAALISDCAGGLANPAKTIAEYAEDIGMSTGVVSTARITHATPAAVYAHSPDRDWESDRDMPAAASDCTDIASQLIAFSHGNGIDVILGGGRSGFYPDTEIDPEYPNRKGRRGDGRNLVSEFEAKYPNTVYVWNEEQFLSAPSSGDLKLFGLFEPSHMQYELDRATDGAGEPSLAEMTQKSISLLSQNPNGYYLMVESGRIDHAHHMGNAARALADTQAFDQAVETALGMVDLEDTLIIVTADHGHTISIAGYAQRGNPILGVSISTKDDGTPSDTPYPAADGKPYTTLSYANGPGSVMAGKEDDLKERPFVTMEDAIADDYLQQSLVPSMSETHGGQDVTIMAGGPDAYLFDGVVEQNYIFHVIDHALGLRERAAK